MQYIFNFRSPSRPKCSAFCISRPQSIAIVAAFCTSEGQSIASRGSFCIFEAQLIGILTLNESNTLRSITSSEGILLSCPQGVTELAVVDAGIRSGTVEVQTDGLQGKI